jgi:hypothetical protein
LTRGISHYLHPFFLYFPAILLICQGIFEKYYCAVKNKIVKIIFQRFPFEMLHCGARFEDHDFRKESSGALGLMLYYCILARQVIRAVPIGRQALQEIHSALSGPSPERQRMGRSGWRIRGLDIETKSAAFEVNTSSILLNDLPHPPVCPWNGVNYRHSTLGWLRLGRR